MFDMVLAYRKAKVDCFCEQSLSMASRLADYEADIERNLASLLTRLKRGRLTSVLEQVHLGKTLVVLPKKLGIDRKSGTAASAGDRAFFSDRERAVEDAFRDTTVRAELRVSGEFPIDVYVISALWTNLVGHWFDARLTEDVYGSRLRRFGDDGTPNRRPYHVWATGSFVPYFLGYSKWRSESLRACRRALDDGQRIISVSLDVQSYYHSIDPAFIAAPAFHEAIGLGGEELNAFEREFTDAMASFLTSWGKRSLQWIRARGGNPQAGGLPLALTAARVIANVLLGPWDERIRAALTPIFYGRYVDDMQLVLADPGNCQSTSDVLAMISRRLGSGPVALKAESDGAYRIELGAAGPGSRLLVHGGKQRAFFLAGSAGRDLVEIIEREVGELSSERRLLPEPDQLTHSLAARVLSATTDATMLADRLGRADGLSIRRFGWAVQLRQARTLAGDLPPAEWAGIRKAMFDFAANHILRADRFFEHWDQVPRLVAIAMMSGDWTAARRVIRLARDCLDVIQRSVTDLVLSGTKCSVGASSVDESQAWSKLREHVEAKLKEAIVRNWMSSGADVPDAGKTLRELLQEVGLTIEVLDAEYDRLCRHDLGGPAARLYLEQSGWRLPTGRKPPLKRIRAAFGADGIDRVSIVRQFLRRAVKRWAPAGGATVGIRAEDVDLRPFLFPTRPYRLEDFPALDDRCLHDNRLWRQYSHAFRGVWVGLPEEDQSVANDPGATRPSGESSLLERSLARCFEIGAHQDPRVIRLALANLRTDQTAWAASAEGRPMLTLSRYQRLAELVNDVLRKRPRPDYLILPELSVPERWVASLSSRLLDAKVNLIAGMEYRHYPNQRVRSHALLLLSDDRLGFTTFVRIEQPKAAPAVREEFDLLSIHGRRWRAPADAAWRRVYVHRGFCFGVLVCSELQDIQRRAEFRGRVDALIVPSWNQDLSTFSSLVESAALDVHAFVAYVNNRVFGDSRVRSPAKADHERDLARIRGGIHDGFVAVEIDFGPLREFQSRAKPWPQEGDDFKPVPTGFVCDKRRRWFEFQRRRAEPSSDTTGDAPSS